MTTNPATKSKNPHRISVNAVIAESGMERDAALEAWAFDCVVPACCDESCEVEPDGRCEHDCPSVLLALGMI